MKNKRYPKAPPGAAYLYVFSSNTRRVFKIGVSNDPEYRITDCAGATLICSAMLFETRKEAHRCEAALRMKFWRENIKTTPIPGFSGTEWYKLTIGQLVTMTFAETVDELWKAAEYDGPPLWWNSYRYRWEERHFWPSRTRPFGL
jgi:hypothetical protein